MKKKSSWEAIGLIPKREYELLHDDKNVIARCLDLGKGFGSICH